MTRYFGKGTLTFVLAAAGLCAQPQTQEGGYLISSGLARDAKPLLQGKVSVVDVRNARVLYVRRVDSKSVEALEWFGDGSGRRSYRVAMGEMKESESRLKPVVLGLVRKPQADRFASGVTLVLVESSDWRDLGVPYVVKLVEDVNPAYSSFAWAQVSPQSVGAPVTSDYGSATVQATVRDRAKFPSLVEEIYAACADCGALLVVPVMPRPEGYFKLEWSAIQKSVERQNGFVLTKSAVTGNLEDLVRTSQRLLQNSVILVNPALRGEGWVVVRYRDSVGKDHELRRRVGIR